MAGQEVGVQIPGLRLGMVEREYIQVRGLSQVMEEEYNRAIVQGDGEALDKIRQANLLLLGRLRALSQEAVGLILQVYGEEQD